MSRARSASTTDDSSESSESSLSSSQGGQQFKVVVGADSFKDKPVAKWSIKEVCGWLNANGFEEYAQFFVDEMVDGESLITLSTGDLNNLGIKKLGQRNKLFNKIEKLKETGLAVGRSDASSSLASGSEDGGEPVTIKALFKQKTATLKVSSTITLDSLLNKLAEAFGGIRVKIRIVDDDEEQIAIGNDIELANVLAGEDQVEFQCSKDLKATAAGVSSKSSKSPSASSSSSSGVAPAAPAAASRSINVNFDLFETLLDGYCAIDEDGLVLYVNAALERMFGYSRRKVIGHNVKMLMPDSYAKKHDMYLARYMTTGVKHVVDKARVVMAKAANGAMFPITLSVTEKKSSDGLTYFIGAMKLATEAGEDAAGAAAGAGAAAAVVDEFAGVRKTLDALQEAAVVIDETGRIVVFNGAAEKLFGHKASAIIDQPVETLMPSPFKENHAFYLSRYVATGKKTVMGSSRDVQALRADGTVIVVNLALSEEKSKSGDPLFIGLLTPAVKRATAPASRCCSSCARRSTACRWPASSSTTTACCTRSTPPPRSCSVTS